MLPVFIVAVGRSGSTSLLHLLRELPNSHQLLGENGGLFASVVQLDSKLRDSWVYTERQGGQTPGAKDSLAWVHNAQRASREATLAVYRHLLSTALNWEVHDNNGFGGVGGPGEPVRHLFFALLCAV